MKDLFSGYHRPDDAEFAEIWENCLFVLDANILLNLYRYSEQTREAFLGILEGVGERLWIPHQVALEYQDNRLDTIAEQTKLYDRIDEILGNTAKDLRVLLGREHPSLDVDGFRDKVEAAICDLQDALREQKENHPDLLQNDPIRERLATLFEGRVGQAYAQDELAELYKNGQERYAAQVPPGYKDESKKTVKRYGSLVVRDKYGDLVLWRQMIDKAEEEQKPIIFVTDDAKEDWWWMPLGNTLGPRPELVTEMKFKTGMAFYMYSANRFMTFAGDYLKIEVGQDAVDEVQEVAEETGLWRDEISEALAALGGEAYLADIYSYVRRTTSRELPETWQATVRFILQLHSSDTGTYRGGQDLFEHLGRGYWGLRKQPLVRFGMQLRQLVEHRGNREPQLYVFALHEGETLIYESSDVDRKEPVTRCVGEDAVAVWAALGYIQMVKEDGAPDAFVLTEKAIQAFRPPNS
jgi:hypothetical protein